MKVILPSQGTLRVECDTVVMGLEGDKVVLSITSADGLTNIVHLHMTPTEAKNVGAELIHYAVKLEKV